MKVGIDMIDEGKKREREAILNCLRELYREMAEIEQQKEIEAKVLLEE